MDEPPEFHVARRRAGDAVIVAPEGDVDLETADAVRDAIAAARRESAHVVVDLRGVTFMDSSGLRLLVQVTRELASDGAELSVVRGPAAVERLFGLSGLAERLRLVDDPSELGAGPQ